MTQTSADMLEKSPSQFAREALQNSNVDMAMIQKIKSMGQKGAVHGRQESMDVKQFPVSQIDSDSLSMRGLGKTKDSTAGFEKSSYGQLNRHQDNKLTPEDDQSDLFERGSSGQIF